VGGPIGLGYGSLVTVRGNVPAGGQVVIQGPITDRAGLTVAGDVYGLVRVEAVNPHADEVLGPIEIGAKGKGVYGAVEIAEHLKAGLRVNGSFLSGGRIWIKTLDPLSQAYASIDWDWDYPEDVWDQGAPRPCVTLGSGEPDDPFVDYCENTPERHILDISDCRGDLNGDRLVNNFDIDPFALALSDPVGYAGAFPGLDGSRIDHGDLNCDGVFDNFDVDAFTLRLSDVETYRCVYPNCEPCAGPCSGGGDGLGAQAVGELYKKSVAPDRLPYVIDAAEFLAGWYKGSPRGKFWTEVHAALVR